MARSPDLRSPVYHRALLFVLAVGSAVPVLAQADKFGRPSDRPALGNADQAEGAKILAEFRRAGIAGDYWLAFELRVMPREGPERVVPGTLIGTRGVSGPLSRLNVGGQRWLIESGPQPSAWMAAAGGSVREVGPGEGGLALADTGVTVFEVQMPFLYWTDFTYEGEARVRGRPTHSFVLRPPAGQTVPVAGLTAVRVLIDREFQAMVKADELGAGGVVEKTISLLDLKKVGEQWLVKTIDVRDARTRNKTRFSVTAAALGLEWPIALFGPDGLAAEPPEVPAAKIVRF
jgi:hypothetical protein